MKFPATDIEFAMQAETDELRKEVERLTDTCSEFAQANAALQDTNELLTTSLRLVEADRDRWVTRASETIIQADAVRKREQGYLSELSDYAREMPALRAENERLRTAVQQMFDLAPVDRAYVVDDNVNPQGQLRRIREIGYAALQPKGE
jgi:FtsZ-binding cell division protein ZapB